MFASNRSTVRGFGTVALALGLSAAALAAPLSQIPVANALPCSTCYGDGPLPRPLPTPRLPAPTPTPAPVTGSPAPHGRAQLVLQTLYCYDTTELGHDEVYFRLGGTNGDGKSIGTYDASGQAIDRRGPSTAMGADADNGTAWDMNDSGDLQNRRLNAIVDDESLSSGQIETLYFGFAESDGTNIIGSLAQYGATAVGSIIGGPTAGAIAGAAGSALKTVIPANQDDFLGNFGLQVANTNGAVHIVSVSAGEYASIKQQTATTFTVHVEHDEGSYDATFAVQGQ
jgi:hypothetical protein